MVFYVSNSIDQKQKEISEISFSSIIYFYLNDIWYTFLYTVVNDNWSFCYAQMKNYTLEY